MIRNDLARRRRTALLRGLGLGAACILGVWAPAARAVDAPDAATMFGTRESVESIALSPDGSTIAYVQPAGGQGSVLFIANPAAGTNVAVVRADGDHMRLGSCGFVSNQRLVCTVYTVTTVDGLLTYASRLTAINADGSDIKLLGEQDETRALYARLNGGRIVDYLPGSENSVLMEQEFIPENTLNRRTASSAQGLGVVRLDTHSLHSVNVEDPRPDAERYLSDGRGVVRIMSVQHRDASGNNVSTLNFFYRRAGSRTWEPFVDYNLTTYQGSYPLAVDPQANVAYVLESLNGRDALYRVSLDGSLHRELAASNDQVDIEGVLRIGRQRRVIGATYVTDRREATTYFDPALHTLSDQLRHALPHLPLVNVVDASEDEQHLLIWAGSDTDPGRYYILDRPTHHLAEIMLMRPQLEHVALAPVQSVTYRAADGTMIPAYLTLPPGSSGHHIPAIVMPHGGPGYRDEWGFDWLVQYYANRGYAVLQPNFRGSTGYGDAWFQHNGFQSWRTAIGDVVDAGRWLVSQGIADPDHLAIVGWSYGGYAALQANVIDPNLFQAVVAVAPVTDLTIARDEWRGFTNAALVRDYFGQGPHLREGSPAENAAAFHAPVLMFHGDRDRNVGIAQSREMDSRLRAAGHSSELVVYPGLDHQLDDSTARADMLRRSDAFLRQAMHLPPAAPAQTASN